MASHKLTIRIPISNMKRLIQYQAKYKIDYHQSISYSGIINGLILGKLRRAPLSTQTIDKINNRFNDHNYKRMMNWFFILQKYINQLNLKISGGFNNLNQLTRKANQNADDDMFADRFLTSYSGGLYQLLKATKSHVKAIQRGMKYICQRM